LCELQQHIAKVQQSRSPLSPVKILNRIRNIGSHLGYGKQEDAHEFMSFAINSMQSICLDEVGGAKAVDISAQETTLIQYIFGGQLQSQVKCMQCLHESNRYENMMDLAVEIQGNIESLEDALAQFTAPEKLQGDNKYKCDRFVPPFY
jgi:ubiquitin carboxyl-terminal hydrolase 36/42